MELNNSAEMNEPPLLAIGRQSYDLTSAENVCQPSSNWHHMDCNDGSANSKNGYWESDVWRAFPGDLSCTQTTQAQHRAKRQHCWSATSLIPENLDDHGPGPTRMHLGCNGSSGQGLHIGPFECCETMSTGNTGFDFFSTGLERAASSSSSAPSHNSMPVNNLRQATLPETENGNGPNSELSSLFADHDWKMARMPAGQPLVNPKGKISEQNLSRCVKNGECSGTPTFLSALSLPLEDEIGKPGGIPSSSFDYQASQRSNYMHGDSRASHKRKISSIECSDASTFDPHSVASTESGAARAGTIGNGSYPNGLTDFNPVRSPSTIQLWGESHSDCAGYVSHDTDYQQTLVRERTSSLAGSGEDAMRCLQNQPLSALQEPTHPLSHSLFARNLRRTAHSHSFTRTTPDVLGVNNDTNGLPGIDHWPPLVAERSAAPPVLANWAANSSRRSSSAFSRPGSRERVSSTGALEGYRLRSMPGRALDWPMAAIAAASALPLSTAMEHRLASQMIAGGGVAGLTGRRNMDLAESSTHISQAANSFSNSGILASYFPATGSNEPRANRTPPPPPLVPSHQLAVGSPIEAPSAVATQHGSHYGLPSPSRGRREALLSSPIQSILGFHMLRADGEYRRQFLSEILNAMHNALRNEDLNFEELVMLDPSMIYGDVDAHDQHRDMRLDVDNMTYEELLVLEERIGNVSTGLDNGKISLCLRESKYSSLDATVAALSQESDVKCSICQEEFVEEEELGRLDCGHGYHSVCIKQWLVQKNECPICKSSAYVKP